MHDILSKPMPDAEIVALESGSELECNPIKSKLTGKLVLVKLGDCLYSQKLINAKAADVTGAVIYNNAFDIISFLPDTGPEAKVPFVGTG
jgi:hypothetical protein